MSYKYYIFGVILIIALTSLIGIFFLGRLDAINNHQWYDDEYRNRAISFKGIFLPNEYPAYGKIRYNIGLKFNISFYDRDEKIYLTTSYWSLFPFRKIMEANVFEE